MGELEKQPFEPESRDPAASQALQPQADNSPSLDRPADNWEGYSLEILSIWFDP
jgi:hypothetical protein